MGDENWSFNVNSDFIPGTINIYSFSAEEGHTNLKVTKDNVILVPQPSDSINDPLNWSRTKKLWNFCLLALITGFTVATSNDAEATQDSFNELYGISYEAMNSGVGVLFIVIGWSTFLLTPAASLYGRKLSYMICLSFGAAGAIWFALSKTTSSTIWSQFFVGVSEACAEAHVQQSLTDMYFQHQLGAVLTVYILATSVGTYMGPMIAGFIIEDAGINWVGWIAAIISVGLLATVIFGMHETIFDRKRYLATTPLDCTLEETVIERKGNFISVVSNLSSHSNNIEGFTSVRREANEPKVSYWKLVALVTGAPSLVGTGLKQYFRSVRLLFRVFLFPPTIFSGLVWGMQDALLTFYLTAEDNVYYDPPYNYSAHAVAIMNVPCLVGAIIGCVYAGIFSDWFTLWMARRNHGIQEAEYRLYFLLIPAILTPVGLVIFAVGTDKFWPWQATYFGLGLIGVGFGSSGDVAMGYLMDAYPDMVIEMMAGVSVINNMFGCIFAFSSYAWLDALGNIRTFVILAVMALVVMGSAVPFIIFGKRIRKWTKPRYLDYCRCRYKLESD